MMHVLRFKGGLVMANYKVCILAAGVGSRVGDVTQNINKALLPINFKAVISYII